MIEYVNFDGIAKIKPFIPLWNKEGNKLIQFEDRLFDDNAGHIGVLTVAIFKTKKGEHKEMDAWIKWNK